LKEPPANKEGFEGWNSIVVMLALFKVSNNSWNQLLNAILIAYFCFNDERGFILLKVSFREIPHANI